jgi:hypothetical protein
LLVFFSGFTPLDYALDAGHRVMVSLLKVTLETKKPVVKLSPSPTVAKKTVIKSLQNARPASRTFAKSREAVVPKIERPTRVAAKKCK